MALQVRLAIFLSDRIERQMAVLWHGSLAGVPCRIVFILSSSVDKPRHAMRRGLPVFPYDSYAQRCLGFLYLAAAWLWLKSHLNIAQAQGFETHIPRRLRARRDAEYAALWA